MTADFLFFWHGTQKLLGFPAPIPMEPPAFVIFIAGLIELVGGLLVMIGLFTSRAAFLYSGLMAAACWMAHGTKTLFPLVNGGELAALYCFIFHTFQRGAQASGAWTTPWVSPPDDGNRTWINSSTPSLRDGHIFSLS